jgi:hypothetical protein
MARAARRFASKSFPVCLRCFLGRLLERRRISPGHIDLLAREQVVLLYREVEDIEIYVAADFQPRGRPWMVPLMAFTLPL